MEKSVELISASWDIPDERSFLTCIININEIPLSNSDNSTS